MRIHDAWGIQFDALNQLHEQGCEEIRILEEEENKVYSTPLETIWKKGTVMDYGDGSQAFLPRSQWKITDAINKK